jgi:hypothetical protein
MSETQDDPAKMPSKGAPTTPARELLLILRDTVFGVALFVFACFVAGLFDYLVPIDYPHLYFVWFTLGMIPFAVFANRRGAFALTARGVVLFALLVIVLTFQPKTMDPVGMTLILLAVICVWVLVERLCGSASSEEPNGPASPDQPGG